MPSGEAGRAARLPIYVASRPVKAFALNRVFAMSGAYRCDFAGVVPTRLVAVRTPHR